MGLIGLTRKAKGKKKKNGISIALRIQYFKWIKSLESSIENVHFVFQVTHSLQNNFYNEHFKIVPLHIGNYAPLKLLLLLKRGTLLYKLMIYFLLLYYMNIGYSSPGDCTIMVESTQTTI